MAPPQAHHRVDAREGRPRMTFGHWVLVVALTLITTASIWLDNLREK